MNNEETLTGSCLCGECKYAITSELKHFFQCYSMQCRKTTASAFAANIIAARGEIRWASGEHNTTRFDYRGRGFTQVFCKTCGSGLPFHDKGGEIMFIPAGTLDNDPSIKPQANIFWRERAKWYEHGMAAPRQQGFDNT